MKFFPAREPEQQMRISVYVSKKQYLQLKAALAAQGKTVSKWLRREIQRYINTH